MLGPPLKSHCPISKTLTKKKTTMYSKIALSAIDGWEVLAINAIKPLAIIDPPKNLKNLIEYTVIISEIPYIS